MMNKTEYVNSVVIERKILAILNDDTKVAIILNADHLSLLIECLERSKEHTGCRFALLTGLRQLHKEAFQ